MWTPWGWWIERRKRLDEEAIAVVTLLGYRFVPYVAPMSFRGMLPQSQHPQEEANHWGCFNDAYGNHHRRANTTRYSYECMRASGVFAKTPGKCAREILRRRRKALKMSAMSFSAWGSLEIEKMERLQRRKYINLIRAELKEHGLHLHAGGSKDRPTYKLHSSPDTPPIESGSMKQVCTAALDIIDGRRTI